jgi:O-antigen ligase
MLLPQDGEPVEQTASIHFLTNTATVLCTSAFHAFLYLAFTQLRMLKSRGSSMLVQLAGRKTTITYLKKDVSGR